MKTPRSETAARLAVKVQPGSAKNRILGNVAGEWKIAVTAPPVEGGANAAVIELLSRWLGVPKSAIRIMQGHTGRRKLIEVMGISAEVASQRLSAAK